jgi:hypothetical protein
MSSDGNSSGVGSVDGGTGVPFSKGLRRRSFGVLRATVFRPPVLRGAVLRVSILRPAARQVVMRRQLWLDIVLESMPSAHITKRHMAGLDGLFRVNLAHKTPALRKRHPQTRQYRFSVSHAAICGQALHHYHKGHIGEAGLTLRWSHRRLHHHRH